MFLRQGSHYIKAHTYCRVQSLNPYQFTETETINPDQCTKRKTENINNNNDSSVNRVKSTTENKDISNDEILPSLKNEEYSLHSEKTENLNQNLKLKTNDVINFMNENNDYCIARIIGPAGKSTGKYTTCKNIEYEAPQELAGTKTWIDLSTLQNLSVNQSILPNEQSEPNNSLPKEEIF